MLLAGKATLVLCRYLCLALGKHKRAEQEGCCCVCLDRRDSVQQGPICPIPLPQAGLERCHEDNALSYPLWLPLCLGSG